ncbi:TniQ family protein [Endozoicomonas sp. ALB032]|uniref:TniQ family protein n=1 Tax=Endozoicomonas sp. ALB032 TaxID=3403082 RepID=UPI003BB5A007
MLLRPCPKPNELLTSWMTRLAHRYGQAAPAFYACLFENPRLWYRDLDCNCPESYLQTLSRRVALPVDTLIELSLKNFNDVLPVNPSDGLPLWVMPVGIYHRERKRFGLQYCPLCLEADGYWRQQWRLAWNTGCPEHQIQLWDCCPACRYPVQYHLTDPAIQGLCHCSQCGYDLRNAKQTVWIHSEPAKGLVEVLNGSLKSKIAKWLYPGNPTDFALGLRFLAQLITGQARIREMLEPLVKMTVPSQCSTSIQRAGLSQRAWIIEGLSVLLEQWPGLLKDLLQRAKLQPSRVMNVRKNIPLWIRLGINYQGQRPVNEVPLKTGVQTTAISPKRLPAFTAQQKKALLRYLDEQLDKASSHNESLSQAKALLLRDKAFLHTCMAFDVSALVISQLTLTSVVAPSSKNQGAGALYLAHQRRILTTDDAFWYRSIIDYLKEARRQLSAVRGSDNLFVSNKGHSVSLHASKRIRQYFRVVCPEGGAGCKELRPNEVAHSDFSLQERLPSGSEPTTPKDLSRCTCQMCLRSCSRLTLDRRGGSYLKVCDRCYRRHHKTCSRCRKYRSVVSRTPEGKPLCQRCTDNSASFVCPVCEQEAPFHSDSQCIHCYHLEKVRIQQQSIEQKVKNSEVKQLVKNFCQYSLTVRTALATWMLLRKHQSFFVELDHKAIQVGSFLGAVNTFDTLTLRRHLVIRQVLEKFHGWAISEEKINQQCSEDSIQRLLASHGHYGLIVEWAEYLESQRHRWKARTRLAYLRAAVMFMDNMQGQYQVSSEAFLSQKQGYKNSLQVFLHWLSDFRFSTTE